MIIGQIVKQPGEAFSLTVDFTAELAVAETVTGCVVTSRNYATGADTTSAFLTGAAGVATPKVSQKCQAGAHGETHVVQFKATTSAANIYEHEVEVAVAES